MRPHNEQAALWVGDRGAREIDPSSNMAKSVAPAFIQQERLRNGFAEADGRRAQRCLDDLRMERNLLINGGGRKVAMRSFGGATRENGRHVIPRERRWQRW